VTTRRRAVSPCSPDAADRASKCSRRHGVECRGHVHRLGGWLPPVGGAVFQEIIDVAAVVNALRAAVTAGNSATTDWPTATARTGVTPPDVDSLEARPYSPRAALPRVV
jgi:hypothetical protein